MAPEVGFEPTTLSLTARRSTIELLRNKWLRFYESYDLAPNDLVGSLVKERGRL